MIKLMRNSIKICWTLNENKCEKYAIMMIVLMRTSIKICWNLKLAKPWFLRHVPSENRFLQDSVIPNIYKKSWKIDAKSMLEKWWKIDAKMAPKIHENGSQNRPGADIGLQFLVLGGFWSDAKISWFSDAFLEAQKTEKIAQRPTKRRLLTHASAPGKCFFGIWAPGRPRARPCTKVQETRNRVQRIKGYWKKGKVVNLKGKTLFEGI